MAVDLDGAVLVLATKVVLTHGVNGGGREGINFGGCPIVMGHRFECGFILLRNFLWSGLDDLWSL